MRVIFAILAGFIIGSIVNMSLITLGGEVIPPPIGVDNSTMESLAATMHLFEPQHFLFPWLAHSIGTLSGAIIALMIAKNQHKKTSIIIGCLFLAGGIIASYMLPAPMWFIVLDITLAYLPMSWLATKFITEKT